MKLSKLKGLLDSYMGYSIERCDDCTKVRYDCHNPIGWGIDTITRPLLFSISEIQSKDGVLLTGGEAMNHFEDAPTQERTSVLRWVTEYACTPVDERHDPRIFKLKNNDTGYYLRSVKTVNQDANWFSCKAIWTRKKDAAIELSTEQCQSARRLLGDLVKEEVPTL